MKILCIGGGSMGRRRLRDLTHLDPGKILLCEKSEERCRQVASDFGAQGFTDLDEAFAQSPDVVTVSTPPALHEESVRRAMKLGAHVFSEVPFVLHLESMREIASHAGRYPALLAPSHSIRMYPPVRLIRDLVSSGAIGAPLYFEHSLGQHLAGWHAYEHYKDFYAGDIGLGGSGTDMIAHEFLAIQWWMGKVKSVYARLSKVSSLEVKGPDLHDVLVTFTSGARGFFHNDIIELGTTGRHVRIVGETGTIEWHEKQPSVRLYRADKKASEALAYDRAADWEAAMTASREISKVLAERKAVTGQPASPTHNAFTFESCYLREMRHFINAVEGRAPYDVVSLAEELHSVELYHAVFRSSETKQMVQLPQ